LKWEWFRSLRGFSWALVLSTMLLWFVGYVLSSASSPPPQAPPAGPKPIKVDYKPQR
jgi:hypothetical protein